MNIKPGKSLFILLILVVASANQVFSQFWNPNHKIGTITGKQEFVYNQVPDQLVEIYPARPNGSLAFLTFKWEISTMPISGFADAPGLNDQQNYTLPYGLTGTIYLRRKTTHTLFMKEKIIYSNAVKIRLVSTDWEDINYTREYDIAVTGVITQQQVEGLPIGSKFQTTTYVDGIGRTLQQVSKGTAKKGNDSTWGDIVSFDKYDTYSRVEKDYLPYTTTSQPGKYKTSPETEQQQYYSTVYNETSAFGFHGYDNSPLDNIKNVKRAGTSWAANTGNSLSEETNSSGDNVQMFGVDYIQGNAPVHRGAYPIKSLFKQVYTDVNGKKVIEFIDKDGNLVLKKVQLDDSPVNEYTGWICTYSIYDDFGLLRYQLQPEAVKYLYANGWSFAGANGQQVLNELCFQYDHDEKGRVIWKKAPGAQPLKMLYDSRDRVVFMQDGNQAAMATPQWTVNLYDALDRKVATAHYLSSASIATLQAAIDNAPASSSLTISTTGAASVSTILSLCPIVSNINNSSVTTILGYIFYDNYGFSGAQSFNSSYTNTTAYSTSDPNVKPIAWSKRTLDFPTGTVTRVLGTNTCLTATDYYDEDGDHIQTSEGHLKPGIHVITKQYHFDGRLLSVCSDHTVASAGYINFKTLTKHLFDKIGRVTTVQKQYGSNTIKTVATYEYDDMGRLKNKTFDPGYTNGGNNYLESLDYSYNLHNEITGINKDYALKTPGIYSKWKHSFGLYLGFDNKDNVFTAGQLNGKVAGMMWSTMGDDVQRRYDFSYDNAGRLINSVFKEQVHLGDGWNSTTMDFSVSGYGGKITYDLNGNLLTMSHKGIVPGTASPITIDDLRYTYASYSNKLQSVKDEMTVTTMNGKYGDFKDGTNGTGTPDYVYDQNGNLVIDLNKNVKDLVGQNGIVYNYLDKPEQIKIAGKGIIKIVYSAAGEKLQRVFIPETGGATSTITTYIHEFVYQETSTSLTASSTAPFTGSNLALGFINFEEGRIRVITPTTQNNGYDFLTVNGNLTLPNSKMGVYDYFVTDYQENVRVILTEEIRTAGNVATMEEARSGNEVPVFGQAGSGNEVNGSRYDKPSGWSNNSTTKVSRLGNLAGINLGPNTLQKVMAGDAVSATVKYYYQNATGGTNNTFSNVILGNLLQLITGGSVAGGLVKDNASAVTNQLGNAAGFVNAVQPAGSGGTRPQAFLTVLFFDERFKLVPEADGGVYQQQVAESWSTGTGPLVIPNVKAPKNGYMYAFISNRSDQHVYFDDFAVNIVNGNLLEENHYYSYGLKIAGISSKRLVDSYDGLAKNDHLYNDKELWDDGELNWYDYGFRNYDPQIGRFVQLDPLTDDYPMMTPYQYASCEPIANIDLDGLEAAEALNGVVQLTEIIVVGTKHTAKATNTVSKASRFWNWVKKAADVATDFMPFIGSAKDIYRGFRDGNGWQVALGVGGLVADVFTMGGASVIKGTVKTILKQSAKTLVKEEVEQVVKSEVRNIAKNQVRNVGQKVVKKVDDVPIPTTQTKGGTYVLKDGDKVVRTGRTKDLSKREIQHKGGKETKDLTFEAVHHTDDYGTQRGLEHMLSKKFEATASKAKGGLNKIKAMSDKVLNGTKGQGYLKAAEEHLSKLAQ